MDLCSEWGRVGGRRVREGGEREEREEKEERRKEEKELMLV